MKIRKYCIIYTILLSLLLMAAVLSLSGCFDSGRDSSLYYNGTQYYGVNWDEMSDDERDEFERQLYLKEEERRIQQEADALFAENDGKIHPSEYTGTEYWESLLP